MILSGSPAPSEEPSVPRALSAVVERKWLILAFVVAGLFAATVDYLDQRPLYVSEAVLALDARKLQALPIESVVSSLPQESPVLRTEVDIISSRSMAERVLVRLQEAGVDVAKGLGLVADIAPASGSATAAESTVHSASDRRGLIDRLLSSVRVTNDGRSYTIYITVTGIDPVFASTLANVYAEAYIDYQVDLQTTATRHVSDWLGTRLVSLRSELERSEHAATEFREKSGIVESGGTTLIAQQIAGLNTELAKLRAQVAGANARLATALDVSKGESGLALSEVLSSAAIQQLRMEEARLKRSLATISESGAVKNPQIPELKSQLETIQAQIDAEVAQIVESLRNEIEVARRQQAGLEASLKQLQAEMSSANEAIVQADQLDREASANRTIYESYLARYKQTIEQDGIAMAEARIISPAVPSKARSSPDAQAWLVGGFALGLTGGLLATILLELRSLFLRRGAGRDGDVGVPVLGRFPKLSPRQRPAIATLLCRSQEPLAKAVADVQGHLRAVGGEGTTVVAVTSAEAGEGKTFVAACLARSFAASGLRTLLLDADVAEPGVAREFATMPAGTLADLVADCDEEKLRELVRHDTASGVDLLATATANRPVEHVVGHKGFARLMAMLREAYDVVVVDAVAVAQGSGALLVSRAADMTVLVAAAGGASAKTAGAVRRLEAAGIPVEGLIVDEVPADQPERRRGTAADRIQANEASTRIDTSVDLPSTAGL